MKRISILTLGMVAGLCALPRADAAVQFDRVNDRRGDQICVYKDINYYGAEQCYRAGEEVNNLGAQSKSISSIRVYGQATVTVYEKAGFSGHSAKFTSDVPDLGKEIMSGNTGWSDRIISIRTGGTPYTNNPSVDSRTNSSVFGRNSSQQQPRDGICVYDRPNYEGRSDCWNQGQSISDLSRQGNWSGRISSIRLFGSRTVVVVYQDTGYRGRSMTVNQDIPNLAAIGDRGNENRNNNGNGNGNGNGRGRRNNGRNFENWDRQIMSLQVQAQQRQNR